jgi:Putative mono-oxygenase ydhR
MSVILQVNYTWDVEEDVANRVADNAERYNDIPGLQWKLWIRDPDTKTSGGIHLFTDRESARAYFEDVALPVINNLDGAGDIEWKILGINEEASRLNRTEVDVAPLVAA